MNAVDTNVLIYSNDPRVPAKRQAAQSLIADLTDGVLLWQVACEYLWASRKLAPFGYDPEGAWQDVLELKTAWRFVIPDWSTLERAKSLQKGRSLGFWDALIISACEGAGVARLYTEDFAPGRIDGVEIINPFLK